MQSTNNALHNTYANEYSLVSLSHTNQHPHSFQNKYICFGQSKDLLKHAVRSHHVSGTNQISFTSNKYCVQVTFFTNLFDMPTSRFLLLQTYFFLSLCGYFICQNNAQHQVSSAMLRHMHDNAQHAYHQSSSQLHDNFHFCLLLIFAPVVLPIGCGITRNLPEHDRYCAAYL